MMINTINTNREVINDVQEAITVTNDATFLEKENKSLAQQISEKRKKFPGGLIKPLKFFSNDGILLNAEQIKKWEEKNGQENKTTETTNTESEESSVQRNKRLFEEKRRTLGEILNKKQMEKDETTKEVTLLKEVVVQEENADDITLSSTSTLPRNITQKEWNEVPRDTENIIIGDLDGSYQSFQTKMIKSGMINSHGDWIGGNKRVVFQGDILADRSQDGFKIIKEIHKLKKQTQEKGGDILILVGNHDASMINYLVVPGKDIYVPDDAKEQQQGSGLLELLQFSTGNHQYINSGDGFQKMKNVQVRDELLSNMRNNTEGRIILEELCSMKIVEQIDDCLHLHTNPTNGILENLTKGNLQKNIDMTNTVYQSYLRKTLLGEKNSVEFNEFKGIDSLFLDTGNRETSGKEEYYARLRQGGINYIAHGHNRGNGIVITVGSVTILDNNYSDSYPDKISKIGLDGQLYVGTIEGKGLYELEKGFPDFDKKLVQLNGFFDSKSIPDKQRRNDFVSEYNTNFDFYKNMEILSKYSYLSAGAISTFYEQNNQNMQGYVVPRKK